MNREDVPPLDADVLALLAIERPIVVVEAAQRTRGLAAVEALLAGASLGSNDAGGGADLGPGGASGAVANGSAFVLAGGKAAATIAAAFFVGAVAGGIGVFGLVRKDVRSTPPPMSTGSTATVSPTSSQLEAAPSVVPTAIAVGDLPDAAVRRAAEKANAKPIQEPPVVSAQGLAAERALLDVARSALGRGSPDEALEAANRHSREYPNGLLTEEREALAIRALAGAGHREAAVARATRFRARYPKSLLLPAVEGAVGQGRSTIP